MTALRYDRSFDGFLSLVFEVFRRKLNPEFLLGPDEPPPLLAGEIIDINTDQAAADRVWRGLEKKFSAIGRRQIIYGWLAEGPGPLTALGYVRAVYAGVSETDFSHPAVLGLRQAARKVSQEIERLRQFVRFQKTAEGVYFAALAPDYDVLPLALEHFRDRFGDQKWAIYDLKRSYGFYYDLTELREIGFFKPVDPASGRLAEAELAEDELLLQQAWQSYYNSINIAERANPRQQLGYMPRRYWAYLTEKQDLHPAAGPAARDPKSD